MFQIGQTVIYGTEGVCTIEDRRMMKFGREEASYFVLRPVFRTNATVFVPEDNAALVKKMHAVLSREEIDALLQEAPKQTLAWIDDPNERRTAYQKLLTDGERVWLLRLIHTLRTHRESLQSHGKHLRATDDQLLREAEKLLHDEFALVLEIPQNQVHEYIRSQISLSA